MMGSLPAANANSPLVTQLLKIEAGVDALAKTAHDDYKRWACAEPPSVSTESKCFYDACKGKLENPTCTADVKKKSAFGGCSEQYKHVVMDFDRSRITFAKDPDALSGAAKRNVHREVLWSSGLTDAFIAENKNEMTSWQYIGMPTGTTRLYPATPQDVCYTYDPRVRPWYVAASSGPKDVVIVIDTSGSMSQESRLEITKTAVNSVLDTLTLNDYVSVVRFSDDGKNVCGKRTVTLDTVNGPVTKSVQIRCGQLMQATSWNKAALKKLISEVVADGGTNFLAGIEKAIEVFKNTGVEESVSSGCDRALLFLTDGKDASDQTGNIRKANEALDKPAVIFTYSLGSGADAAFPKQMACESEGIWSPVVDGGDIRGQMSHFYDYFAAQRSSGDSKVTWVEPYKDAYGAGWMTTASKAIYDESESPPELVGVVGIDVLIKDIMELAKQGSETLIEQLARRSATCLEFNVAAGKCTLSNLRKKDYSITAFSAMMGTAASDPEDNRLCASDPKGCIAREPQCADDSGGAEPDKLDVACGGLRDRSTAAINLQSARKEACGGPCQSANGYSEGKDDTSGVVSVVIGIVAALIVIGAILGIIMRNQATTARNKAFHAERAQMANQAQPKAPAQAVQSHQPSVPLQFVQSRSSGQNTQPPPPQYNNISAMDTTNI
jgi:hypothetical protein